MNDTYKNSLIILKKIVQLINNKGYTCNSIFSLISELDMAQQCNCYYRDEKNRIIETLDPIIDVIESNNLGFVILEIESDNSGSQRL